MCTTGAKILTHGREFILFKNRDFTRSTFDDRVQLTDRVLGVLGLETWDGEDGVEDSFSGFSIGFNTRLACCDSNVRTVEGGESYDKLVEAVVEHADTVDDAISVVRKLVHERLFCWANMVVATVDEVAALEVRDHHVEVERGPLMVARANHHVCLGASPDDDDTVTTDWRFRTAFEGLQSVNQMDDLLPLLKSRHPEQAYGISNRGTYNTVYSYLIHWKDGQTTFYVYRGQPSDGGDYVRLPIRLGQTRHLPDYPSSRTFLD